jgi:chromosome segregation ATPase
MATPGINTKVKMDGEKEYRAALAQINAGLKNLGAEMRATEQDFADNADSVEALTQKNDVLERTILTQREKVEKLKEVVADATETYKEADKRTIDWKTSLIEAETKLKQMQRALDDNNTALEEAKNATDNLSGEMDDFGQQTNSAAEKVTDAADDIGTMGQKAGDAQRETMGLGSTVDQLTNKLGFSLPEGLKKTMDGISDVDLKTAALVGSFAGVAAAIVGVEKKLVSLTTEAGASAKELLVLSEVTGQSTDELQEFDYMSKFLGVSTDQLSDGLKEITNKMQEARDGSADAADAFGRLGVRVTDSRGELRDASDVFYEVIDALGEMRNKTERDATAMDLLSESARNFNPLINRGSEVLKAYAEEAHNTGYVLSEDTLKALTQVDDAYQHMLLSQEASKNQLAEEFAPYLTEFYQNLESIITDLADAATDSGIIDLLGSLLELASELAPVLSSLADMASALKPIFETLAGAISLVADGLKKIDELSQRAANSLGMVKGASDWSGMASTAISAVGAVFSSKTGRHAAGTDNYTGGVTWVGENGPELVYLPQRTQISNAQESRRAIGGDTFYVTINAKDVKSFNDVVRIADNKRRSNRMGVK